MKYKALDFAVYTTENGEDFDLLCQAFSEEAAKEIVDAMNKLAKAKEKENE